MRSIIFITVVLALVNVGCDNVEKDIPPPKIYINMPDDGFEIEPDSVLLIEPKITYDYNSRYEWKKNGVLLDYHEKELKYESPVLKSDTFQFAVFTPEGSDSIIIPVHTIIFVNFEEFGLDEYKTHINYSSTGYFNSKGVIMPVINDLQGYWSGFAVSIETNTTEQSEENQFSVYTTSGGADRSAHFSVFRMDDNGNENRMYFSDEENHTLKSISVNNSTYTALTIKRGDDNNATAFDYGDWYLLTIKGYDTNGLYAGKVEFYLADYRFENSNSRYVISSWNTVDLRSLGRINSIEFVLTSSDSTDTGIYNTPLYFCLDNVKILD
ncbi:MAG: DUF4465 domain-containing protein [Chlorobi bacterium]|nr:DUF4465 domain-containing protein [Chlorobiota bacterium]